MPLRSSRRVALALVAFATFTDIVAYSIAVPVLPDLGWRLGASPTMIGLLFASFGVTLLTVSVPTGAVSDRIGRNGPLVGGMIALAASTVLFAFATTLPMLFAARLVQGAADAVTWVVGFALIADLYGPEERGGAMGVAMGSTSFAFMLGPTLGGWLYEVGGIRLPFVVVGAAAAVAAAAFAWFQPPSDRAAPERVPLAAIVGDRRVAICTGAVIVLASTLSMIEPVWPLFLTATLGTGPARVGLLFGFGAVATALLNPVYGRGADRWGGRRLMVIGLLLSAALLPMMPRVWNFGSAVAIHVLVIASLAMVITPSLAYMADAVAATGIASFGVAYGLYNFAWGVGVLAGPAAGGFLLEHAGFSRLTIAWAACVALTAVPLGIGSSNREERGAHGILPEECSQAPRTPR